LAPPDRPRPCTGKPRIAAPDDAAVYVGVASDETDRIDGYQQDWARVSSGRSDAGVAL